MKQPIIFDGAFGTYYNQISFIQQYPELANINDRDTVLRIHKEYIDSGVHAIKTNTFGANTINFHDQDDVNKIISNAYEIALQATKATNVRVFADIGPVKDCNAELIYLDIVKQFMKLGATNYLFETLANVSEIETAIKYIKNNVSNSTVVVSFAVSQDGYTASGENYIDCMKVASNYGADYVGLNCICGPVHMLELICSFNHSDMHIIAMPNSGYPDTINGRTVYMDNPEYFADRLYDIFLSGAEIVGGCCGTTPAHIKAFVEKISSGEAISLPIKSSEAQSSNIVAAKRSFDKNVIAVELNAPNSADVSYLFEACRRLKECGANYITIPDSPLAKSRANSIMISSKIKREVGIDVIPHLCCRDKNQIALKGDLIAGAIDSIDNILIVTGDPITEIDRTNAKNVFGMNSLQLIKFVNGLNQDIFANCPYNISGALNINATNFDVELSRAEKKINNGASALFTQPIFSNKNIQNFKIAKEKLNCKIFAGIMPIASYRNALFLNNEVPGIEIPSELIEKLKDKELAEVKKICVDYSIKTINEIKDIADGYYIMTPMKKIDFSEEIVKYIRGM